jgi:hypothetical protein
VHGRNARDEVREVWAFTGSAFRLPKGGESILRLGRGFTSWEPEVAWELDKPSTVKVNVSGWSQGGTLRVGKGRIAAFGEAAMFSAQLQGTAPNTRPMGMNDPRAKENPRFVLNVMRWLGATNR